MGKPSISIIVEKQDVFFPGQTVRGKVAVKLSESLEAKVIFLRFIGKVDWKFADGNEACLGRGNLFNNEITLLKPEEQKRESEIFLDVGEYDFPFQFILPSKLPSSYQHKLDNIRHLETSIYYGIEAVINKKFPKQDDKSQLEFRVEEVCNLDIVPGMKENVESKVEKQVTFLGMNYGLSRVEVSVPKRGYYLGETINPMVKIDHSLFTHHTKKIYIELIRETHYLIPGKVAHSAYLTLKNILLQESLEAQKSYNWTEPIKVPLDVIPAVHVQDCLEIKYCLKLSVELVRGKDIACYLPIVVVQPLVKCPIIEQGQDENPEEKSNLH